MAPSGSSLDNLSLREGPTLSKMLALSLESIKVDPHFLPSISLELGLLDVILTPNLCQFLSLELRLPGRAESPEMQRHPIRREVSVIATIHRLQHHLQLYHLHNLQ